MLELENYESTQNSRIIIPVHHVEYLLNLAKQTGCADLSEAVLRTIQDHRARLSDSYQ